MNRIKLILPFLVVLTLISHSIYFLAWLSGGKVISYNGQLEGRKILMHKDLIYQHKIASEYDIVLAGTSRTMADFSPICIKKAFNSNAKKYEVSIYNLGNVANNFHEFKNFIKGINCKVLVLEFSPHTFLSYNESIVKKRKKFDEYRKRLKYFEMAISGYCRKVLFMENMIKIKPEVIRGIPLLVSKEISLFDFFYLVRSCVGYGQVLQNDGQVLYRRYLPDCVAANGLSKAIGIQNTEYNTYKNNYLQGEIDERAWNDFIKIINIFNVKNKQVVIVRPPISAELYSLENDMQGMLIKRMVDYSESEGIVYIDLNPHNYFSTDMSHIDWYDTEELSIDLARRLAKSIEWGRLFRNYEATG